MRERGRQIVTDIQQKGQSGQEKRETREREREREREKERRTNRYIQPAGQTRQKREKGER